MRALLLAAFFAPLSLTAQVRQLRVVPDPAFDTGDLELGPSITVRADRANRVYLADRSIPAVYLLSENGSSKTTVIREGAGPGEMREISISGWLGDTLWIFDNRMSRFNFLAPEGRFLRTEAHDRRCTRSSTWGLLADGGCLEGVDRRHAYARGNEARPPLVLQAVNGSRKSPDTLGTIDFSGSVVQFDFKDGGLWMPHPFPNPAPDVMAISADGKSVAQVVVPAHASGTPDSLRLRLWRPGIGWGKASSVAFIPRPLPRRVFDNALAVRAEAFRKSNSPITMDSLHARVSRPEFYPPIRAFHSASDGTFWLQVNDATVSPSAVPWIVYDSTLKQIARVSAPPTLALRDARDLLVWGVETDQDDVPRVVRYRLVGS
jgi:hypothetical protein